MTNSDAFHAMAERIERAGEHDFGGAFVLVAPDGKMISHMLSSPEADIAAFWGFVKAVIEEKFQEYQQSMTQPMMGWPRR